MLNYKKQCKDKMIATKTKYKFTCTSCGKPHVKESVFCPNCQSYNTIISEEVKPKRNFISPISKKKQQALLESKGEANPLDIWFGERRKEALENAVCENCGASVFWWLESEDNKVRRSVHGHIIPKSKFPSCATHPLNHVLLCGVGSQNCCHQSFDSTHDIQTRMVVFPLAKERFNKFKHLITESTSRLNPQLLN